MPGTGTPLVRTWWIGQAQVTVAEVATVFGKAYAPEGMAGTGNLAHRPGDMREVPYGDGVIVTPRRGEVLAIGVERYSFRIGGQRQSHNGLRWFLAEIVNRHIPTRDVVEAVRG